MCALLMNDEVVALNYVVNLFVYIMQISIRAAMHIFYYSLLAASVGNDCC